ncbi:DUF4339 domain-containing protein [Methylosinus sp. PW1]|uniref:DUF4339 domain-containing protein n=1 Tax=Methylosinus sp. PW1 TaxID=107636 RepID=UPI00055C7C3F|nr:DUF4339 domain-containing protein [Methylosinus sp. PW1]
MADQEAVWHVIIDNKEYGPLTKAQVLEYFRNDQLTGNALIWRTGFPDWRPARDVSEFWQPPKRTSLEAIESSLQSHLPDQNYGQDIATVPSASEGWSLWKSANIGLFVSALMLLFQILNGRGFELANYAHTASAATISGLLGQILAAPLIFVWIAVVRNILKRREAKSRANAFRGAITFLGSLGSIMGLLLIYGEVLFSRNAIISGEARKAVITDMIHSCVQKQRALGHNVFQGEIERYCACVSEKIADLTTYKQLGAAPDASALADLKQRVEAAAFACR